MSTEWDLHQAQLAQIEAETQTQPLIGPLTTLAALRSSISPPELLPGFDAIVARGYSGVRRVRGDGNCFFRALMFSLVQQSALDSQLRLALLRRMQESLDFLVKAGYQRLSVETFQEMMVELFQDDTMTAQSVEDLFSNASESQHIVWFARLLCAGYLKVHAERFLPFLSDGYFSVAGFCAAEVEPVGREAEEIHIIALCEYLQIEIRIEYLTLRAGVMTAPNVFEPLIKPALTRVQLLYRVGHYDLLI